MNALPVSDRRQDILDAALLCFEEVGIEATSIDMVRVRSGASVGSIYHHFGSKEGIVSALFFDVLDEQTRGFQTHLETARDVREGVRALVLAYVDWVTERPQRARYLFEARAFVAQGPRSAELVMRAQQRNAALVAWFAPHQAKGDLLALPCDILPSLVLGPAQSYCRAWLSALQHGADEVASPQVYRDVLADTAWRVIGMHPGA